MKKAYLWKIWAKSLGVKSGNSDAEADDVAKLRTMVFIFTVTTTIFGAITNAVIIAGVIRHWNN